MIKFHPGKYDLQETELTLAAPKAAKEIAATSGVS